ncbi:alpha-ketoglutarate-dependent dioxygenase AlkB family protein [Legionella septentrionalis]|uniref:alpha-ketoglutarate-dependent dioxygenase AlkB family protein n=1 Tax=Legionella septentrionalis TaxID=2498109 RepID=UPI000F8D4197|nr:alpha-ketoglutarate-dependent dioxygenase AlkB [Legionella septentrionalis]RUQ92898.1 alpha-ketoglutarate-dependent dioxygenase AlkB [Legionella septentrionalis]
MQDDDLRIKLFANILPYEGEVYHHGIILTKNEADYFFNQLFTKIVWKPDEAKIFGKHIITKRKIAWYADKPFSYTYSRITRLALTWSDELLILKSLVEKESGETYNSCLLNLYHDGSEGMAWHSDGEKDLKKNGAIASLSLGAERKFSFKNKKTKEVVSIVLSSGSLLMMKGSTQAHWLHRLPPTKKIQEPRINLTFRTIETSTFHK